MMPPNVYRLELQGMRISDEGLFMVYRICEGEHINKLLEIRHESRSSKIIDPEKPGTYSRKK